MGRPRTTNLHLPKYVKPIHGSLYWCPPAAVKGDKPPKPVRICRVGEDHILWRFMADTAPTTGPITTMTELFDRYTREVLPRLAPRTQKDYLKHLKKLRTIFGNMQPKDIRTKDVGALLQVATGKIQAKKTVAVLSTVFGFAVGEWFVADVNPCKGLKLPKSGKRTRYITDAEYKAVYDLAPARLQIAMEIAYTTSQRQGDVLALKWKQIDSVGKAREDWRISFQQGKTGKKVRFRIGPRLEAALARARKLLPDFPRVYVIRTGPRRNKTAGVGGRYTSDGFRAIWQRVMRKAVKTGAIKERFTFHDIRAKHISDRANIEDAMVAAGHESMQMTRSVYDRGWREVDSY